jgi:hypothetical protein
MPPPNPRPTIAQPKEAADPNNSKPPVAANRDQILNRIALSLAKHQSILGSLSKSRSASTNAAAPKQAPTAGGSFSSLRASSSAQQPESSTSTSRAALAERAARLASEEASFREERALPPNAGIGWVGASTSVGGVGAGARAGKKSAREEQQDKILAQRLLGGAGARNRKGEEMAAAAAAAKWKRKMGGDGDDDEEEGRSAVGRAKRVKRGTATAGDMKQDGRLGHESEEMEGSSLGVALDAKNSSAVVSNESKSAVDGSGVDRTGEPRLETDGSSGPVVVGDDVVTSAVAGSDGESKKQQKQRKRNKHKNKKKAAEGTQV